MSRYVATLLGAEHEVEVEELSADSFRVRLGQRQFDADLKQIGPVSYSVVVADRSFDFDVVRDGEELVIASRGGTTRLMLVDAARRAMRKGGRARELGGRVELKAVMPGRVISVLVQLDDDVKADQGVMIIEAMKMENELKSPKAGKVTEVNVAAGQTVEKGEVLLVID
ncbi:MAG: biotin/lipoyl-containing protein [Candidatus Binataceae bacterium]